MNSYYKNILKIFSYIILSLVVNASAIDYLERVAEVNHYQFIHIH